MRMPQPWDSHARYPDDLDAATLYAASLMNLCPWNYWTADGRPKGQTEAILKTFGIRDGAQSPTAGALHYYIHAVEARMRSGGAAAEWLPG